MKEYNFAPIFLVVFMLAANSIESSVTKVDNRKFSSIDVFSLEWASDPQISPDGSHIIYVRNFMDIMKDRRRSNLWVIDEDANNHEPLTTGNENDSSPLWAPDGSRIAYISGVDGTTQLYVRWINTGKTAKITNLTSSPNGLSWSPDGRWLAFSMHVPESHPPFAQMPPKPDGAEWAEAAKVIRKFDYRADGTGYLEDGYSQLFVVPADGGSPRQLTSGAFNHDGRPSWTPDGETLIFSANRHNDWEHEPLNSEVYSINLSTRLTQQLTNRVGPDVAPTVSPDGEKIAYIGFDDRYQGYQVMKLYVMNRDGSNNLLLTETLDRDVESPYWKADNSGLFFSYDNEGDTKIAFVPIDGKVQLLGGQLGGTSIGRPYAGGSFSVSTVGTYAFTYSEPTRPADVGLGQHGKMAKRLTDLNGDLLNHKDLGSVEMFWFSSSHDGRKVQGWVVKPPGFDKSIRYPLILEIHGGPFTNYGGRFAAEVQLFAAAGYVVLYINPRGSTSYGQEFGNLIHHAYPSEDFDDLMSGVDTVISSGYIDDRNLFVTGGSGGGVLTSWIVGHTNRFRAAVAAKPVINWYSWALTADMYASGWKYWFPGFPWNHTEHYMKRSPITYVGNVTTPTMLLTGEDDYRTPMPESEQYYQALKLRKIDTALVRIPGASHGIAARPSNLISKVAHILAWFELYRVNNTSATTN